MITLLDYGAGNVRSVINALERLGETVVKVDSAVDIDRAERLVFPGVGNYGAMMQILREKQLVEPLLRYLHDDRPFFGICVALQALFDSSEEAPDEPGLGFISGRVKRFSTKLAVPHIGWNGIKVQQPSPIFNGFSGKEKLYFVHSYHVEADNMEDVLTTTDYGYEFVSSVRKGNIIATQFHPEKSGKVGLKILENFLDSSRESVIPQACPQATILADRIIACLDVRSTTRVIWW